MPSDKNYYRRYVQTVVKRLPGVTVVGGSDKRFKIFVDGSDKVIFAPATPGNTKALEGLKRALRSHGFDV